MKNKSAQELGKLSAKARMPKDKKGKSEYMKAVRAGKTPEKLSPSSI